VPLKVSSAEVRSFPLVGFRHGFWAKSFDPKTNSFGFARLPSPAWAGGLGGEKQWTLVTLGFVPDWFLPLPLAERWEGPFFPLKSTRESWKQYQLLMEGLASQLRNSNPSDWKEQLEEEELRAAPLDLIANWLNQKADLILKELAHNSAIFSEYKKNWGAGEERHSGQSVTSDSSGRLARPKKRLTAPPNLKLRQDKGQVVQRDAKAEARDRWLYRQARKEPPPTWKSLMASLKREADKHRWRKLSSAQAVQQAVDRYIRRKGLDPLPPRKES